MKIWTGRRLSLLGLVVGVGVAVAGIAYASIPDSNGVIHGCYNSDTGALRVFGKSKDSQQCNADEKALDWSQTARQGRSGQQGRPERPGRPVRPVRPGRQVRQVRPGPLGRLGRPERPGLRPRSLPTLIVVERSSRPRPE